MTMKNDLPPAPGRVSPPSPVALAELGVFDTDPDWTDGRYWVYAACGEADCIRYGQGKRYDFCISRRHHNYYHDYRTRHNATYYFVYDGACGPLDKTHVTVVAARSDGTHEFTYANNAEDYDTRQLRNCLDRFLLTKPGLEQAKALFTCQPLTPEETTDVVAARAAISGPLAFEALTPAQQLLFVHLGNPLTDAIYTQAPHEVREAYIDRAHLLTDPQAGCSTEAQRQRAAQLLRLYNVAERQHTADWLKAYPPPHPRIVTAHYLSAWPPKAADLPAWRGPAASPSTPPAMKVEKAEGGPAISGPTGPVSLTGLRRAVAANPPVLFPVQELTNNPNGTAAGPVIIARQGGGYVVLTGTTLLKWAQMSGDVDIVVQLATRANLACARVL